MSHFFETIKVKDGKISNLIEHNLRLNKTIFDNFKQKSSIDLSDFIQAPDEKFYRCKVIYSDHIESVTLTEYKPRIFQSFQLISTDISYPYKSINRKEINKLFEQKGNCDDILMVKDGLICDTSIANVAIYDGLKWYTPKSALLPGTQRAKLLKKQIIFEKELKIKDIKNMVSFAIMNALVGFAKIGNAKFYFQEKG